jgi:hypothetical protein
MTIPELEDFGRDLAIHLRAGGVADIVVGLMLAGYAVACLVQTHETPPKIEDLLPIVADLLKTPPKFAEPTPKPN